MLTVRRTPSSFCASSELLDILVTRPVDPFFMPSSDSVTLTGEEYEQYLDSTIGTTEGVDEEEEEEKEDVDAVSQSAITVMPGLVLGAVARLRSGRRTRQPAYLQEYCLL